MSLLQGTKNKSGIGCNTWIIDTTRKLRHVILFNWLTVGVSEGASDCANGAARLRIVGLLLTTSGIGTITERLIRHSVFWRFFDRI